MLGPRETPWHEYQSALRGSHLLTQGPEHKYWASFKNKPLYTQAYRITKISNEQEDMCEVASALESIFTPGGPTEGHIYTRYSPRLTRLSHRI